MYGQQLVKINIRKKRGMKQKAPFPRDIDNSLGYLNQFINFTNVSISTVLSVFSHIHRLDNRFNFHLYTFSFASSKAMMFLCFHIVHSTPIGGPCHTSFSSCQLLFPFMTLNCPLLFQPSPLSSQKN